MLALKNSDRKVYEIIVSDEEKKVNLEKNLKLELKIYIKNKFEIDKILKGKYNHQGYIAKISNDTNLNFLSDLKKNKLDNTLIILDNITDVRNIGSIIRSSVAFGVNSVLINKKFFNNSIELYKAASGAIEFCKIYLISNISNALHALKSYNYFIYGLDSNSNSFLNKSIKFNEKKVFVFGSEDYGLRNLTKKNCDQLLGIKMYHDKINSLNVSNAVSSFLSIYSILK